MLKIYVVCYYIDDLEKIRKYLNKHLGEFSYQLQFVINSNVVVRSNEDNIEYYDDAESLDFVAYKKILKTTTSRTTIVINDTFFTKHLNLSLLKKVVSRAKYIDDNLVDVPVLIGPYRESAYCGVNYQNKFVASYIFAFNDHFSKNIDFSDDPKKYIPKEFYKFYISDTLNPNKIDAKIRAVGYERQLSKFAFQYGILWFVEFGFFEKIKEKFATFWMKKWK